MFKEILTEAEKATIFMNRGFSGSGLCKGLSEKETNSIMDTLKNHSRSDYELMDFIDSVDEEEKYSETLVIRYQSKVFTLYAANGRLRLGAGGSELTGCKLVKKIDINGLSKALKDAPIVS
jgi:hypothetical protein